MNNTVKDFNKKLKEVCSFEESKNLFSKLDKDFFIKVVQKYIILSTQDEFNFIVLLEVKDGCTRNKEDSNSSLRYFRILKNILINYYQAHRRPLDIDFINKYNIYKGYLSEKYYSEQSKLQINCLKTNVLLLLNLFDGDTYNLEVCTKSNLIIQILITKELLDRRYLCAHKRLLNAVLEYSLTNKVTETYTRKKEQVPIKETLKLPIDKYLRGKKEIDFLDHKTIRKKQLALELFARFFNEKGYNYWNELTNPIIINFINSVATLNPPIKKVTLSNVRGFLHFLFEIELTIIDYGFSVPSVKYTSHAHLPSMYTPEEIQKTLDSINRSSIKGKRNYCLLLILARYGLRASDICNLQHNNIDWDSDKISIIQQKTKKVLVLQLLPVVGNALIDYYKIRPNVESNYIFIRLKAPYNKITANALGGLLTVCMQSAGVDLRKKRHGAHSWRHSLSGNLMQSNISVNYISKILGHSSINTTVDYYISSNLNQLKECSLKIDFSLNNIIIKNTKDDNYEI
jgi:integrase